MTKTVGSIRSGALHVFALCSLALAQPLFDLLQQNPEFFVARKSEPLDVVLLVVIVSVAIPLALVLLEWSLAVIDRRLASLFHRVVIAALVAVILLPIVSRAGALPDPLVIGAAAAGGALFCVLYERFAPLRSTLTVLSLAAIFVPVLFVLNPAISELLLREEYQPPADVTTAENPVPIVLIVFDELPITSIMNTAFDVDAERFPGFAALAAESTWYRYARTDSVTTTVSVPSILTANMPSGKKSPTVEQYPNNLFTWLRGNYEIYAFERATNLCPKGVCNDMRKFFPAPGSGERLAQMSLDAGIVYLHIVAPADLGKKLPSISGTWGDFASVDAPSERKKRRFSGPNTPQALPAFIDMVDRQQQPALYFLHVVLPHIPWVFYPSGKAYAPFDLKMDPLVAGAKKTTWMDDEFLVAQGLRRHLLQVELVDHFLGALIDKMKRQGYYDSALFIVTADHGVGFNPGSVRKQSPNGADSYLVPLFVKYPGQKTPERIEREVVVVDILPTIAEVIRLPIPWPVDGIALSSDITTGKRGKQKSKVSSMRPEDRYRTVELIERTFDLQDPYALYNFGRYRGFGGETVKSQQIGDAPDGVGITIRGDPDYFLDPESNFVPGLVAGTLYGDSHDGPVYLAVATGGVFRVTTRSYLIDDEWRFSALLPEDALRPGKNRVEIYLISEGGDGNVSFLRIDYRDDNEADG